MPTDAPKSLEHRIDDLFGRAQDLLAQAREMSKSLKKLGNLPQKSKEKLENQLNSLRETLKELRKEKVRLSDESADNKNTQNQQDLQYLVGPMFDPIQLEIIQVGIDISRTPVNVSLLEKLQFALTLLVSALKQNFPQLFSKKIETPEPKGSTHASFFPPPKRDSPPAIAPNQLLSEEPIVKRENQSPPH